MAEPSISQITDCWNDLDVTMIGIGTLVESLSEALRALFSDSDFRELDHYGAVGNICTRFYDTGGNACPMEIHQRMLNISFEQLRRVPVNIAVAGGIHKWRAIRSAMIGKIIDVLVTDEHTARAIVEAGTEMYRSRFPNPDSYLIINLRTTMCQLSTMKGENADVKTLNHRFRCRWNTGPT